MDRTASRPLVGTALPLLLLVVGIAMLAVLAWSLLHSEVERPVPAAARSASNETAPAISAAPAPVEQGAARADGSVPTATRADEPPAFDLPDEGSVAALEQSGRALFFGLVTDFNGEPCPDALLFHDGAPAGRSDAQGFYRVEVAQPTWNWRDDDYPDHHLVALKEGIGSGGMPCQGLSRRIDLSLSWRGHLAGRVVARAGGPPLPGAKIECLSYLGNTARRRDSLFHFETVAGADGRFEFIGIAPGNVELRGQAPGFASDNWTPFEMPESGERTNVAFPLEPLCTVRGHFVPWPLSALDVREARVVGFAGEGRSFGPGNEPLTATPDDDGLFTLQLARCNGLDLLLEVAGGALWRDRVEFGFDRGPKEIDLGRIALPGPATVTGHVTLPADVLELGFELEAAIAVEGGSRRWRAPVGPDGKFRLALLPPGPAVITVVLGGKVAIGFDGDWWQTLDPDSEKNLVLRKSRELLAGQILDLGEVALVSTLYCGRVVDAKGVAIGGARVCAGFVREARGGEVNWSGDHVTTDEQGRYALLLPIPDTHNVEANAELLTEQPPSLLGVARGMISEWRSVKYPGLGAAVRVDLRLGRGRTLRGVVRDDQGRPLRGCTVNAHATNSVDAAMGFEQRTVTRADGTFEMTGLADVGTFIGLDDGNGSGTTLGPFELSDTPLELVLSRGQ